MRSVVAERSDSPDTASQISQYSGILVAAFPLAQCATSMLWATWADKFGRRRSILTALAVSVLSNLAFGFSRTFGALMFWRILAGIANGNVGVMRTMTAEIVREKRYETKAFLLLPLIFNSGMVVGLALGGCLADPVINLPWLFGSHGLFNITKNPDGVEWAMHYPYALPAMFNAFMLSSSLTLGTLWMRETLTGSEEKSDFGLRLGQALVRWVRNGALAKRGYAVLVPDELDEEIAVLDEEKSAPSNKPPSPKRPEVPTIWTKDVITALISFGLLPLHNGAFMHIFPVFLSNPPADHSSASLLHFNGGLGLGSPSIGLWLALLGICGIMLQLFIYPRMQARIGTLGNFRVSLFIFPLTYLLAPYLSFLDPNSAGKWFWIVLVAWSQIMARTLAIPSTVILLTNSAPAKHVLGRIHGFGNMLSSFARAVGPAIGGWVFAWGMKHNMIGLVWWSYLMVIALCALAWSYRSK